MIMIKASNDDDNDDDDDDYILNGCRLSFVLNMQSIHTKSLQKGKFRKR